MTQTATLARRDGPIEGGGLTKAGLDHTRDQLVLLENFVKQVLKKDQDYGVIPGTNGKPTLLKPGAANIVAAFNCHVEPTVDESTVDPVGSFVSYEVHVDIVSNQTGAIMARGFAQANSYEDKWRYRNASPKCPECGKETVIKGKTEYGGGFLCWKKKGGCGAKFPDDLPAITEQVTGKVENDNPLALANTIKKIAIKRATTDAALQLPGVARFFTQDFDDQSGHEEEADGDSQDAPPSRPQARPAAHTQGADNVGAVLMWALQEHHLSKDQAFALLGVTSGNQIRDLAAARQTIADKVAEANAKVQNGKGGA